MPPSNSNPSIRLGCGASAVALAAALAATPAPADPAAPIDHSVYRPSTRLPKTPPPWVGRRGRNLQTSSAPYFNTTVKAPRGAPNVLLIMTDDVGFGASSTFGGPIPTPTFDALARRGERYNAFNTTALCAPTRAALLTGRNPHSVGWGIISEMATGYPGYDSVIPRSAATVGRVLRDNGYSTAWLGKDHNTPEWENTPQGPYDHWPTGLGFEYFYGFMGGATSQWRPELIEDTRPVMQPADDPGYILDHDLADHAVDWLKTHDSLSPDKPFFLYYAPGTSHSPHHAPADWIARFKGRFDMGWDRMREETLARQKRLGIVPRNADLSPRPPGIPAWDSLTPDQKRLYERMMEVYAGALAYCDDQIGRVIAEVAREGKLDNTLIIYIQGDNGGSGEGGPTGSTNDIAAVNGMRPDLETMLSQIDDLGGPKLYNNYPVGWAWAMNTPFQWVKQVASHFGGTRNGMVISWPARMKKMGGIRTQFHHVIDIAPTIYDAAGVPQPAVVDGVRQQPIEGVSMTYTFDHPDAPSRRAEQYFEMQGNAALYKDGWIASTTPTRPPWVFGAGGGNPTEGRWQLYDLKTDWSQAHDVAARYPGKLKALEKEFWAQARAHDVLPIDSRSFARWKTDNRPSLLGDRTHFTFFPSSARYSESAFPDVTDRSWRITAEVSVGAAEGEGTVIQQGQRFGGWGLILEGGKPVFIYKASDSPGDLVRVAGPSVLAPGRHEVRVDVRYDGGGDGKGALAVLSVDGTVAAQQRIRRTIPALFSGGASVGLSYQTIDDSFQPPSTFTGKVERVDIDLSPKQEVQAGGRGGAPPGGH